MYKDSSPNAIPLHSEYEWSWLPNIKKNKYEYIYQHYILNQYNKLFDYDDKQSNIYHNRTNQDAYW